MVFNKTSSARKLSKRLKNGAIAKSKTPTSINFAVTMNTKGSSASILKQAMDENNSSLASLYAMKDGPDNADGNRITTAPKPHEKDRDGFLPTPVVVEYHREDSDGDVGGDFDYQDHSGPRVEHRKAKAQRDYSTSEATNKDALVDDRAFKLTPSGCKARSAHHAHETYNQMVL